MTWHLRGLSPTFNSITGFASGKIIYLFHSLALRFSNAETKIHALLVERGQKNNLWYLRSGRQAPNRYRLSYWRASWPLSLLCPEVWSEYFFKVISTAHSPLPLPLRSLKQQGFHTEGECVVDSPGLTPNPEELRMTVRHGYNWWNTEYNPFLGKYFLCCGINIYSSPVGKHCPINTMFFFLMVCLCFTRHIMKFGCLHYI